jgi:hypothetical protein
MRAIWDRGLGIMCGDFRVVPSLPYLQSHPHFGFAHASPKGAPSPHDLSLSAHEPARCVVLLSCS